MSSEQNSKVTLYIVRHGEAKGNVEKAFIPPHEDILTEKGKSQAECLGLHLSNVQFTRAYSSDYARTHETAKILLKHQKGSNTCDLKLDKRIRERNMGIYEGKKYRDVLLDVVKSKMPTTRFEAPEGETVDQIDLRAKEFFHDILNEAVDSSSSTDETILMVSHALFLNCVMNHLQQQQDEESPHYEKDYIIEGWESKCTKVMINTAYMKLEITRKVANDGRSEKFYMKFLKIHEKGHLAGETHANDGKDDLAKFIQANPEGRFLSDCIQA